MDTRKNRPKNQYKAVNRTGWKSFFLPVILTICMFVAILVSGLGVVARTTESVNLDMERHLRGNTQIINTKLNNLYESINAVAPTMSYQAGYTKEQMLFGMNALMAVIIIIAVALFYIAITRQKLSNEVSRHSMMLADALSAAEKADLAKSKFFSRMSHEIRTPLNAIIGYNTIAQNRIKAVKRESEQNQISVKVADCLRKSGIASKHLLAIINDVLDMSAIESGNVKVVKEKFDFKSFITSMTADAFAENIAESLAAGMNAHVSKPIDMPTLFETLKKYIS